MIWWSQISDHLAHRLTSGRAVRRPHRHGRSCPGLAATLKELWLHLFPYFCFSFRRSSVPTVPALSSQSKGAHSDDLCWKLLFVPTRDKAKVGILLPARRLLRVTLVLQTFG